MRPFSRITTVFLAWIGVIVLFLMAQSALAAPSPSPSNPPNVLFIAIDDLAPVLKAYGGQAVAPNLDRLASESFVFDNAFSNAVSCNPSRISMLTSLRPASTGIMSLAPVHTAWREFLADPSSPGYQHYGPGIAQVKTVFEHFKDHGYFVANAGKVFHNNEQLNEPWWDLRYYWDFWPGLGWPANRPLNGLDTYYQATGVDWGAIEQARRDDGTPFTEQDLPDYLIAQNALKIVDALPEDRPFFMGVGFLLPHLPWYVPQRMLDLYPLDQIQLPPVKEDDLEDLPPEAVALVWQGGEFYDDRYVLSDETQWRRAIAHYLAGVSYADEQIGRVLSALEARGMLDNTIIVVWGDHGYHFGEKKHLQKHTLWEPSTRVPLMIRVPGMEPAQGPIQPVVNSVDIFPTLVDLAGLPMPDDFPRDGRSLTPLMRNPDAFWPWPAVTTLGRWGKAEVDRATIRTPGWRYIDYDLDRSRPTDQKELYFRMEDPHEWTNLLSPLNGNPDDYRGVRIFLEAMLNGQIRPDAPPVASSQRITATVGLGQPIALRGEDANLDYLLFTIKSLPSSGRLFTSPDGMHRGELITQPGKKLSGSPGWTAWVIYEPAPDAAVDSFTFEVSDGRRAASAQVAIHIDHRPLRHFLLPLFLHASRSLHAR